MYIVQKRTGKQWSEVLRTDDLSEATAKAESYAGGPDCYAEPNGKLKRGFFGFHETNEWKAKIDYASECADCRAVRPAGLGACPDCGSNLVTNPPNASRLYEALR